MNEWYCALYRCYGELFVGTSSIRAFFILTFGEPSCPAVKRAKAGSDKMAGARINPISDDFNAFEE